MRWRPIEEAEHLKQPISGKEWDNCPKVLLWVRGDFYTGRWDRENYAKKPRPHWDFNSHHGKPWIRANQPTHFMLPEPPE